MSVRSETKRASVRNRTDLLRQMAVPARPALSHRMASILVLEDDFLVANQIGNWLVDANHTVVGPAASVDAALAAVAEAGVDVALLDINLGDGLRSYELARILAAQRIPFVFLTGYSPSLTPPDLRDRPRLDKPFERQQVLQALQHVLAPMITTREA